ncbi:hypothetical protein ACFQVC_15950 [Streptomyces monticola]|uniref:DUF4232 domain-containing protein n=1 Tax=Streptomyces monticola TaxID=2666263 RepID=A0ABW2JJL4_9ACTN
MSKFGQHEHEHEHGRGYEHEHGQHFRSHGHDGHDGHEHGQHDQHGQHGQHGGNEAVNSGSKDTGGPQDIPGTARARRPHLAGVPQDPGGSDGPGGPGGPGGAGGPGGSDAAEGLGQDELALRRLLQGAVKELEPSDQALDRLRHAVPARRARKRQAVVGVAAAALFIGTAVPALVHVAGSPSSNDDRPSAIGHSSEIPGGNGSAKNTGGGEQEGGKPSGKDDKDGKSKEEEKNEDGKGESDTAPSGGASSGADPTATEAVTATTCDAAQLGSATATTSAPDAEGKVYGAFRVSNTSDAECTVGGAGSVVFAAQGAAEPSKINVADHTAGDPATQLPAPQTQSTALVLKPGTAYEVRFAWVPSESCPSTGASPDPTPSGDGASGGTEQGGPQTQLGGEEGTADGSVSVTHTAEPGAPSAGATITGACAGTIYRTGVLAAS